jgi:hypothetical protein
MPSSHRRSSLHPHVLAVMGETEEDDPFAAVRHKARSAASHFYETFREPPPFNMRALASLRGLHWSDDDPRYSADSEIAPEADGRVVLRINKSRPVSRQRFSIGHEVGHTLFPEYQLSVRCRKAIERSWADADDLLETLCDVAASELMFPAPWFHDRVGSVALSAESIALLAADYQASRDATVRRLVELYPKALAAVFFSWKLKPKEKKAIKQNRNAIPLFADMPFELPEPMLRVDYAILNGAFESECGAHIPKDKSIPSDGPIHAASISQSMQDGVCTLDLGPVRGCFVANVLPVFTAEDSIGPNSGCSVVAVLSPA